MSDKSPNRVIGTYTTDNPGPLLFCIGAIHGNEPAGVLGLERVFKRLAELKPEFKGTFMGVIGNVPAYTSQKRYIDHDMNRLWSEEMVERAKIKDVDELHTEEREQRILLQYMEEALDSTEHPKVIMDMHTTSADNGIFSIVSDNSFNRELAEALYAPVVFNLVGSLSPTTMLYLAENNLTGLAFESGQHDDPISVDNHEAAAWLMLEKLGCIQASDIPNFEIYRDRLKAACAKMPEYVEVVYRHEVSPEDNFQMKKGYENFQPINLQELLASDTKGAIHAPDKGLVLMPLYQSQGEDGFFVVQELEKPPV